LYEIIGKYECMRERQRERQRHSENADGDGHTQLSPVCDFIAAAYTRRLLSQNECKHCSTCSIAAILDRHTRASAAYDDG